MTTNGAGWLAGVETRLKRGNAVLFAKDCVLFTELNQAIRRTSHKAMALWAWEFAAGAVATLEGRYADESRPRVALDASRAWAAGEVKMPAARRAILDCHAVARDITSPEDVALCHAVGQACGVVHASGHAIGFPVYDLTALVRRHGVDDCREAVERRTALYVERVLHWRGHHLDFDCRWSAFMEG